MSVIFANPRLALCNRDPRNVRVFNRGLGGFLPSDLAGLALWLNAETGLYQDDAATIPATADGHQIAVWQDQSGNARHAGQTVASKRFTLKLAIQNGRQVLRADGTDDFLLTANFASFPSKRGTLFAVFDNRNIAGNRIAGTFGVAIAWIWYTTQSGTAFKWFDSFSNHTTATDPAAFLLQCITRTGDTSLTVHTNGSLDATLTIANNQPSASQIALGANLDGSGPCSIDLAELLIYDGALSDANRVLVENYLRNRWGTP